MDVPGWTVALPILAIPLTMTLAVRRQAPHQKREAPTGSRHTRKLEPLVETALFDDQPPMNTDERFEAWRELVLGFR